MVTFDAVAPSSAGTSSHVVEPWTSPQTLSWSHTVGTGWARAIVIVVSTGIGPDTGETTTCTFAGITVPSLGLVHSNAVTSGYVQMFGLIGPPVGTNTVLITVTGTDTTASLSILGGSVSVFGAGSFANFTSATGSGTSVSVTIPTSPGNMVIDGMCSGNGGVTSTGPQTNRWLLNLNGESAAGNAAQSTTASSGYSVTPTYSITDDFWGAIGINVIAADPKPVSVSVWG